MKIDSAYKFEQISGRFYSKVRSEDGMSKHAYEDSSLGESFFFGDIDGEGAFVIKHHSPSGKNTHIEPDSFCILGRINDAENGSHIEYSYVRSHLHIEMWIAWLFICALITLLTFFADIMAGFILIAVLAVAFTLAFTDPVGKLRLKKVLQSIVR